MKQCPECKGEKFVTKVDVKHAKTTKIPCQVCGGSGTTEPKQEGVFVRPVPGHLICYTYRYKNKEIASMTAIIRPVEDDSKILVKGKKRARLVGEIWQFDVEKKYRPQYPEALLIGAMKSECTHIIMGDNNANKRIRDILKECEFAFRKGTWFWKRNLPRGKPRGF